MGGLLKFKGDVPLKEDVFKVEILHYMVQHFVNATLVSHIGRELKTVGQVLIWDN